MKIAYIIDWDIVKNSSVLQKIEKKINYWETKGHEVHLLVISYLTNNDCIPNVQNIKIFERPHLSFLVKSAVKTFVGRNIAFGRMAAYLRKLKPEVIYYRPNPIWFPNINKCLITAPTIIEINTFDEKEVRIHYPNDKFRYGLYNHGRLQVLGYTRGIVAVTDELMHHYDENGKMAITIGNGYDFSLVKSHKSDRKTHNDRAKLLFIGTPGQIWQGFDAYISMAKALPEFDFHLVGPSDVQVTADLPNLKVHGYLDFKEIEKLYQTMDIGVGTLALYEKELREATPLKVREYVAHGLPIIVGYEDTDLKNQEFVLDIGCHAENVSSNIEIIRQFILDQKDQSVSIDIAKELIDITKKEDQRLAFLATILEKSTLVKK